MKLLLTNFDLHLRNMEIKFIADVHLGRLAKWLRMLGFDTAYKNSFTTDELTRIAREENRTLLSRNSALAKKDSFTSFIITEEEPELQLQQVLEHFHLKEQVHPFTRCMVCNGLLEKVDKQAILPLLQQNTRAYFDAFWQCRNCRRIYWKGSHYERMMKMMEGMGFKLLNFS